MTGLDIFALIVLFVIAASVIAGAIVLARLPGQVAAKRGIRRPMRSPSPVG